MLHLPIDCRGHSQIRVILSRRGGRSMDDAGNAMHVRRSQGLPRRRKIRLCL